jgi:CRP-like cAMP-binding protein
LLISKSSLDELYERVPKFERYFRLLSQANMVATHRRLTATLSDSADEKYLRLLSAYPNIVARVPQHMIASYLGITPETLSRVRKRIVS